MKVLFLDIDGVLNSRRTLIAHNGLPHGFTPDDMGMFDHAAIGLVRDLCKHSGAVVVLSSAWRTHHLVEEVAVGLGLPVIDRTPSLAGNRGQEIAAWLAEHSAVMVYAIVDDNSDMLESQRAHFVQTSEEEGLSYRDYVALKRILSGEDAGYSHKALFWEEV
ncbi:HAD domain-containing protein [Cupriavidus basilensis]|uniref:HAD domain-containing protein n=1 Tax=Cupriavidus basilensis TaxID=68895 RepID=UPI0039F6E5AD